jgi:Fe-S-cluster containining protein
MSKPNRNNLPPGTSLCDHCTGKCCKYIALPIETPTSWKEFDDIRWYLAHEDISIFVEEKTWYLMVHKRCRHLELDNRCGIYETRPRICREYSTNSCEYEDEYTYDKIFETDQQIYEYAEAILGPYVLPTAKV